MRCGDIVCDFVSSLLHPKLGYVSGLLLCLGGCGGCGVLLTDTKARVKRRGPSSPCKNTLSESFHSYVPEQQGLGLPPPGLDCIVKSLSGMQESLARM